MTTNPDDLVVGGGIGGLSTAFALTRRGLRVRVLERSAEFGEVGAGIQLAPNCTRILDELRAPRGGEASRRPARADGDARRRGRHRPDPVGPAGPGADLGYPYMVIHRSDLHGLFLRACRRAGVELVTDAKVTDYRTDDTGATAVLADGTEHSADAVLAADGLHSVACRLLVTDEPVSSAYVAYRGTVPVDEVDREVDLDEVTVYIGPNATSSTTDCAAARCPTRSPSSSRRRR